MDFTISNRYIACFLHFTASLFIFAVFVFILLTFWYPSPFFTASGGWQGLKIVALVDLVLGPLLTLIVYNIKKPRKELFTDFSIIVLIQLAALYWGMATVYQQRPVAVVFWESAFFTVPANALSKQNISTDYLKKFDDNIPAYIFAEAPVSEQKMEKMVQTIITRQIPPYQQLNLLRPLSKHLTEVFSHSVDIVEIMHTNTDMKAEIEEVLDKTRTDITDNYYIALNSKFRNIILVFGKNGDILGTASAPLKEHP